MVEKDAVRAAQHVLVAFGRMGQVMHRAIASVIGDGLTSNPPVTTMLQIALDGPMRPGQIQDLTGLSSGGVSKMLDRMEGAGLVARRHGALATDRRASVVTLTPKGQRAAAAIAEQFLAVLGEVAVLLKEVEANLPR